MENLGAIADSRYTGFREITDCDVLELHCIMFLISIHNVFVAQITKHILANS